MKRVACLIVFNEMEFLPHNLPFIVDHFDKTIVIDGGPAGTSIDGTWDYLQSNFSNKPHVHIETGTFGSFERENNWNRVMRNRYFELLDSWQEKFDWVHTIDPDEFYHERDLDTLVTIATSAGIDIIRFPFYHFMGDKNHYVAGYEQTPRYLHKFFRYEPDLRYLANDVWVYDKNGVKLADKKVALAHDVHMYHYGYLSSKEKMAFREFRYAKRGDFGEASAEKMIADWKEYEKHYVDRRKVSDDLLIFNGEHPKQAIPFLAEK